MGTENRLRSITEFFGALSIVLSLVFVGLELRHANNLAEAESVQSINEMFAEKLNNDKSEWIVAQLAKEMDKPVMAVFYYLEQEQMMNILESAWKSFDRGIIDDTQLTAYMNLGCRSIFGGINTDEYLFWGDRAWSEYRKEFNPDYIAYIERHCSVAQ